MKSLDLQSEKYSPTGNIGGEGAQKSLGRPKLDPFSLMIREAVQNSWDARISDSRPVRFRVDLYALNESQKHALKNLVFRKVPPNIDWQQIFEGTQPVVVIGISDRGTKGLNGPTRADEPYSENNSDNFVDFFRNIGRPEDKNVGGGGTYGYGKASFFVNSRVNCLIAHTRFQSTSGTDTRFMAAAIGRQYQDHSARFTGRHWWGRQADDGVVEPLTGLEADNLARLLGLNDFKDEETGTTIGVIQPFLGEDRSLRQAANFVVHNLQWHCWPKMLSYACGNPPMIFEVYCQGERVHIPSVERHPQLRFFAQAMKDLKAFRNGSCSSDAIVEKVQLLRPRKDLGLLALRNAFIVQDSNLLDMGVIENGMGIPYDSSSHHVALMRKPELVVQYLECEPSVSHQIGYAGVFLVEDSLNRVFAEAEPPSHDAWNYEMLECHEDRTFVRVALRRIGEKVHSYLSPPPMETQGGQLSPLGGFARMMGGLVADLSGPGAEVQVEKKFSRGGERIRKKRAKVVVTQSGILDFLGEKKVAKIGFRVEPAGGSEFTVVIVTPEVLILDGNMKENEVPEGAPGPFVVGFQRLGCNEFYCSGNRLSLPARERDDFVAVIAIPDEVLVGVSFKVIEENHS